jgi:hypothetical protein
VCTRVVRRSEHPAADSKPGHDLPVGVITAEAVRRVSARG